MYWLMVGTLCCSNIRLEAYGAGTLRGSNLRARRRLFQQLLPRLQLLDPIVHDREAGLILTAYRCIQQESLPVG